MGPRHVRGVCQNWAGPPCGLCHWDLRWSSLWGHGTCEGCAEVDMRGAEARMGGGRREEGRGGTRRRGGRRNAGHCLFKTRTQHHRMVWINQSEKKGGRSDVSTEGTGDATVAEDVRRWLRMPVHRTTIESSIAAPSSTTDQVRRRPPLPTASHGRAARSHRPFEGRGASSRMTSRRSFRTPQARREQL